METTFIYALTEPENIENIRYIGKTNNIKHRLITHISRAEKEVSYRTHKNCWIRSLLNKNLKPNIIVLAEVPKSEWKQWELHYYNKYKNLGLDLTNVENCIGSGGVGNIRGWSNKESINKNIKANPEKYRCKTILKIDINTNEVIAKYESAKICCEAEGFRPERLRELIKGIKTRNGKQTKVNHRGGFTYKHEV